MPISFVLNNNEFECLGLYCMDMICSNCTFSMKG